MNQVIQQYGQQARQAAAARDWRSVKQLAAQMLAMQKNNADGWFLMGLSSLAVGNRQAALQEFSKALQYDGQRYDAAIELAALNWQSGQHLRALDLLTRYETYLSASPKYSFLAAETYTRLGLHEKAWSHYDATNELQKNAPNIQAQLAACSTKVGKVALAIELYDKLLALNPHHQRNHYERARLETATNTNRIEAMQASLTTTGLSPEKNIFMNYAIGKEYEDIGDWQSAFEYYKAGGDAAHKQCLNAGYSVQQDVELIDSIMENCTASWISKTKRSAKGAKQPIFVVGLPRTGTTLVEKIISSHSLIGTADESFFLEMAIKRASGLQSINEVSPSMIKAACLNTGANIADDYLNAVSYRVYDQPNFVEKYPFNFLYIGFIARHFPNSKIVLLKRNAMDACFAMYKQPFFKFSYTLEGLAHYHNAYVRLIEHWRSTVPNLIEIDYETLVRDPEPCIRGLMSDLEFEFESACVNYHLNSSPSATASSVQVLDKPHTRSVEKWRNWETELQSLTVNLS